MFKPGVANSSISMRVQSNATTVDQPAGEDEDEDGERAVGEGGRMKSEVMNSGQQGTTAVWNLVKDLHLELLFMYHRVCLKLAALPCPGQSGARYANRLRAIDVLHENNSFYSLQSHTYNQNVTIQSSSRHTTFTKVSCALLSSWRTVRYCGVV